MTARQAGRPAAQLYERPSGLFVCVSTVGAIFPTATDGHRRPPTATDRPMLARRDAAGAGLALLGGGQYAVGGLAGPVISLAGDSAAASIGMGITAAAALASCRVVHDGTPHRDRETR